MKTRFLAAFLAAAFAAGSVAAGHPAPSPGKPRSYSLDPVGTTGASAWREDLATLVSELERLHPDPFTRTSRPELEYFASRLHEQIPDLAAHQIIVELAALLVLVGDGHTSLPLHGAPDVDFHILPLRLGIYDDGIFIEAADTAYRELVGGRLVSIGGVDAGVALERVSRLISRDNENWILAVAPHLLNRIEVLHALGLAQSLEAAEVVVRNQGESLDRVIEPLDEPQPSAHGLPFLPEYTDQWVDARDSSGSSAPLYQQRFDDLYFWEYMPEHDLLYIKWDQVQNRSSGPSALATFREALAFGRKRSPSKTVIDIRNNTGGEGGLVPPVIREIVRSREIDEPGKLFVIIGRRTFSAAQMMTGWLEQFSSAILVGEPSSAYYNGYAGHVVATLPHSGISFMVSPDYYQMGAYPRDPRRQATPRLAAVPSFADYLTNDDPAIDAVVAYDPHARDRFAHDVASALESGDRDRAEAIVREFEARPINRYVDGSSALNSLGYRHLREGRIESAIEVFELNVRIHPRYANGWDSLGEAYAKAGRVDDAIASFRRALELDPQLENSRRWIERLERKVH